eukprot:TRINITY_DN3515_c0_g1_i2.p1 TRINITY_DN3515_c0_g1~~TRINITY_DN3515_c0_g1_i2.p1  ORF type:complete len:2412 (+),score=457.36 TRINITY_DN3515_c0_g1_i2:141-7376(+)
MVPVVLLLLLVFATVTIAITLKLRAARKQSTNRPAKISAENDSSSISTPFIEQFLKLSEENPSSVVFTFVGGSGLDEGDLTFTDLRNQALASAKMLSANGLQPGDRVVMAYTFGKDFIVALLGCLFSGILAVPIIPARSAREVADLALLCDRCAARCVLTNTEYMRASRLITLKGALQGKSAEWPKIPWYDTSVWKTSEPSFEQFSIRNSAANDVAVIQYTSGSTSAPKGVMLTFGNLQHQLEGNQRDLGFSLQSRGLMWAPHFHDLGLICSILAAMYGNSHLWLMSPQTFIQKPLLWLHTISRVRATHTAAPDFAYALVTRKATDADLQQLDLSSIEMMMSAAEPIRASTMHAFFCKFKPCGIRESAFCPAYGLAEHAVAVTLWGNGVLRVDADALERDGIAVRADDSTARTVELYACGRPMTDVQLAIVNPDTCEPLPTGRVGEVLAHSGSVGIGYYNDPTSTKATFQAQLAGDKSGRYFLRTGDQGFVLDGQLYITGRIKDLIILRGRNIAPQDLEATLSSHPLARPGGVAAFSIRDAVDAEERVAVMLELRDDATDVDAQAIADAVRTLVGSQQHCSVSTVAVGRRGMVSKTSSGKVQRKACASKLMQASFAQSPAVLCIKQYNSADLQFTVPLPLRDESQEASPWPHYTRGLDPMLHATIVKIGQAMKQMTIARRNRVFHAVATTLQGTFTIVASAPCTLASMPPGATHGVLVRHANGLQDDDAAADNRSATVRVLSQGVTQLDKPLLDLVLATGPVFFSRTAEEFSEWLMCSPERKQEMIRERPYLSENGWCAMCDIDSYAQCAYFSKVRSVLTETTGKQWLVTFRLVPSSEDVIMRPANREGQPLIAESGVRSPTDTRARHFLHNELNERLQRDSCIRYTLQIQMRDSAQLVGAVLQTATDCTVPWDEVEYPWHDFAQLALDHITPNSQADALEFNPVYGPADLRLARASSVADTASIGHVRAIVYAIAAAARKKTALPAEVQQLLSEPSNSAGAVQSTPAVAHLPSSPLVKQQHVIVVGAGPSGLYAAWQLEKLGHKVTVLERTETVGGKCASIEIEGHVYDLGGHVCHDRFTTLLALMKEFNTEQEMCAPPFILDQHSRAVVDVPETLRTDAAKYARTIKPHLNDLRRSCMSTAGPALAQPASQWLSEQGLNEFGQFLAYQYTGSGYGFMQQMPMAYVAKFANVAEITGAPRLWTPAGGYGTLWQKVAGGLREVRCNSEIAGIERTADAVHVQLASGDTLHGDALVMALPLNNAAEILDVSLAERKVLRKIRTLQYWTTVTHCTGLPKQGFYLLMQACTQPPAAGQAVTVSFHHRYKDSAVVTFYSFGPDAATVEAAVRRTAAELGGEVQRVHVNREWPYFPHFGCEDMKAGAVAELEMLQGQKSTYFLGSALSFELVETTLAYAHDLVLERFTSSPASESPCTATSMPSVQSTTLSLPQLIDFIQRQCAAEMNFPVLPHADQLFARMQLSDTQLQSIQNRTSAYSSTALAPGVMNQHGTPRHLAQHIIEKREERTLQATDCANNICRRLATALDTTVTPDVDTPFMDLGLDSLQLAQLVLALSLEYDVSLPAEVVLECTTAASLGVRIAETMKSSISTSTIVKPPIQAARASQQTPSQQPADEKPFCHTPCVAYIRGHPVDIFRPYNPTGAAVLFIASAAFQAGDYLVPYYETSGQFHELCSRGITVFVLTCGVDEQLGIGLPEMVEMIGETVRWIKSNAHRFELEPQRLALVGGSAAAHLMLLWYMLRNESDHISDVAAMVAYCPAIEPVEQLGPWLFRTSADDPLLPSFLAQYNLSTIAKRRLPPSRFYHGRYDEIVPLSQVEPFVQAVIAVGSQLDFIIKEERGHPWSNIREDFAEAAQWLAFILPIVAPSGATTPVPLQDRVHFENLQQQLATLPDAVTGSSNCYDMLWLAKLQSGDNQPRFLHLVDEVLRRQDNGEYSSTHPFYEFVVQLSLADVLQQWNSHGQFTWRVKAAMTRAHQLHEYLHGDEFRALESRHGRLFKFTGLLAAELLPAYQCERLLQYDVSIYTELQAQMLKQRAALMPTAFAALQFERHFEEGSLLLHFAELFPEAALRSTAASAHISRTGGHTTALIARYAALVKDAAAVRLLENRLPRIHNGLWPQSCFQQRKMSLLFLAEAGIDVQTHFSEELRYVLDLITDSGVAVHEHAPVDADASAIAGALCSVTRCRSKMPTCHLNRFWNDEMGAYASSDGTSRFCTSTMMFVLEAYLEDDVTSAEEKLQVWTRTIQKLASAQWQELYHLSPFYVWDRIVTVISKHAHAFPEQPTTLHLDAVHAILKAQHTNGGFSGGIYLPQANVEETAFAIKSLKAFLRSKSAEHQPQTWRDDCAGAVRRGLAYLRKSIVSGMRDNYPEMWPAKMGMCPVAVVKAVIVAALQE